MPTGGRKTHLQVIHEISMGLNAAQQAPAASGVLGVLPVGAILGSLHTLVSTAFNSTTNTLSLGTTPGGTQLLSALDLKTIARADAAVAAANAGPFGVDTPIYFTIASTGAAPTAGVATAWLDYLPGPG